MGEFSLSKIELIIFDLDGVLIDSKEVHFYALNEALANFDPKYEITRQEHSTIFDGLSTRSKLNLLHKEKGLPKEYFESIWNLKQSYTLLKLSHLKTDEELIEIMRYLKSRDIPLVVASNSVRDSVNLILKKLGIFDFFSLILANEDVKFNKPHPEILWRAMSHFGALPELTAVFEDSYVGRLAVLRSGATLFPVENRADLTLRKIMGLSTKILPSSTFNRPWQSNNLNVLVPMAGAGLRFQEAGFAFPKPLIEVNGKPLIQLVVENLNIEAKFIFIVQKSHYEKFNLQYFLPLICSNCEIIQVDGLTDGAASTTLLAKELIDTDTSLLIANSDQFLEWNSGETIYSFMAEDIDGGMVTFKSTHPKWSFARLDEFGLVCEVAEKKPISTIATAGVYFWKKGSDYVKYAEQMIRKNIRTNGEFYVCPVFNEAIEDGKRFRIRNIDKMWGLGTPEDLKYFVENYSE
jgi:beta-phosphoglucomutase-like phosphatase (HAD superfamily)/dTDP-glucose pyrophosphorylase